MFESLPRIASVEYKKEKLIVSHGSSIEIYQNDVRIAVIPIFHKNGANIYGIEHSAGGIFVFGERNIAFINDSTINGIESQSSSKIYEFDDQILATKVLRDNKIAILFRNNTIALYSWLLADDLILKHETSVESEHVSVLLKAILIGETWGSLVSVVGTVFGLILVCCPSKGRSVLRTYSGHTGMIFDLLLIGDYLYSISDDRSLRVWEFSTTYSQTSCCEIACEYGHSARPFAIAFGSNHIFTAGIDEVVLKWRFHEGILQIVDRIFLNIGCIRNLLFHKDKLFCCSENGGLMAFNANLKYNKIKELQAYDGSRGFARDGENLYTVKGKGTLLLNGSPIHSEYKLRILSSSPCEISPKIVVAYGENVAIILNKTEQIIKTSARIISCVCSSGYVFCYTVDRQGILIEVESSTRWNVTFHETLLAINKTTQLVPFSLETIKCENSIYAIVGSGCGYLILFEVRHFDDQLIKGQTYPLINRHFKSDIVLAIKKFKETLICLVKNVGMVIFKINRNRDPFISWVHTRSVSNVIDIDGPSGFISYKGELLIAGFHSTYFHLINKEGLSVYKINCGGPNRPWNCFVDENDEVVFEFIKREKLYSYPQRPIIFQVIHANIHRSQIICVRELCDLESQKLICTASTDTSMVFSLVSKDSCEWKVIRRISDSAGFLCVDSYFAENSIFLVTGCGKGRIIIWKIELNEFVHSDELGLYRIAEYSAIQDVRTLSVEFFSENLLTAVFADGSIRMLSINGSKLVEIAMIEPPDLSLFVKAMWIRDDKNLIAISTSGKLHMWCYNGESFQLAIEVEVAKWGLSAISIGSRNQIAIGSESGDVFVFNYTDRIIEKEIARLTYHSCTVTDLKFHGNMIYSISLDCRLARYNLSEETFIFESSKSLPIWDPSNLMISRNQITVVGSGITSIEC